MTRYYISNGKIRINRYAVKYEMTEKSGQTESISNIIQYCSDEIEMGGLTAELTRKGIEFEVIDLDVDDILKYNGVAVSSDEEARRLIEPTVEEVKAEKTVEISEKTKETIYEGIDLVLSDGKARHFSLRMEDQINLNGLLSQVSVGNIKAEEGVPYHADGELCEKLSVADFTFVANKAAEFILAQTTYCNHLMNYVKGLETVEEVKTVVYGQELTGEFLESYNNIMGLQ